MKEKFFIVVQKVSLISILAILINEIFYILLPMGFVQGQSLKDSISLMFSLVSLKVFMVHFLIIVFISSFRLFKLQTFFLLLWSAIVSLYITMYIHPGYFGEKYILFDDWDKLNIIVLLIFISIFFVIIFPKKK